MYLSLHLKLILILQQSLKKFSFAIYQLNPKILSAMTAKHLHILKVKIGVESFLSTTGILFLAELCHNTVLQTDLSSVLGL